MPSPPFHCQARVVSGDTIVILLSCRINPDIAKNIGEQLVYERERIGKNHSTMNNSFQVMHTHAQSMGYSANYGCHHQELAICLDGSFKNKNTLNIDPTGPTPVVASSLFCCPDTLDGDSGPINFNVTGKTSCTFLFGTIMCH